jgi:hypothetical protein
VGEHPLTVYDDDLFGGEYAPIVVPQRREPDPDHAGLPEFYQVCVGKWVVVFYGLVPKQGWLTSWEWPHYWAGPDGRRWRVSLDDSVADEAVLFPTRRAAQETLETIYPPGERLRVGWIEIPAHDKRRWDQHGATVAYGCVWCGHRAGPLVACVDVEACAARLPEHSRWLVETDRARR